ncbi:hypothetical protein H1R20_g1389, partial [Candolleomyces eurysporus]
MDSIAALISDKACNFLSLTLVEKRLQLPLVLLAEEDSGWIGVLALAFGCLQLSSL